MGNLNNLEEIEKFDKGKIISSVRMIPDQLEQAWEEIKLLENKDHSRAENVVICGMGGSALGGRIIDSLLNESVRVPIEISTDYGIPRYVNKKTLVILTSYSGNTEETINALKESLKSNASIFLITTGGEMAKILKRDNIDGYVYEPKANPSGQPRMALGYSIGSTMAILKKYSFLEISDDLIYKLAVNIRSISRDFDSDSDESSNIAKSYAKKLKGKVPVLISSQHLTGVTHAFKNQLNENAKTFSVSFDLPELNHHLLEGLLFPKKIREILHFIFVNSKKYNTRTQRRYKITQEVIEKNGFNYDEYHFQSKNDLEQIFELLTFSSFVSFYLAFLNETDPSVIPWVDYFKKRLSES